MDWTNLTFIGGAIFAGLLKKMFLQNKPELRDKIVPIFAFIGNFLIRTSAELAGADLTPVMEDASMSTAVIYASFWDATWFKLLTTPLLDTLMSWGFHRLTTWRDAWATSTPTRKK